MHLKISFLYLLLTATVSATGVTIPAKNLRLQDVRAQIGADIALKRGFMGNSITVITKDVFQLTDPLDEFARRILPRGVELVAHGHRVEEIAKSIAPGATYLRAETFHRKGIIYSLDSYQRDTPLRDFIDGNQATIVNMSYYSPFLEQLTKSDEIRERNIYEEVRAHLNLGLYDPYWFSPKKDVLCQEAEIRYATSQGALVVVASGNLGEVFGSTPRTKRMLALADEINLDPNIPGAVLYVGSTARKNISTSNIPFIPKHSSLAGRAHSHFLMAPGAGLVLSSWQQNPEYKVIEHSRFQAKNGTSFAAPTVTGAAALVWQKFPTATAKQIAILLLKHARPWPNPASRVEADKPVLDLKGLAHHCIFGHGELNVRNLFEPDALVELPSHSEWPILPISEHSEQKINDAYYDYFSRQLATITEEISNKLSGVKSIAYGRDIWTGEGETLQEYQIALSASRLIHGARAREDQSEAISQLAAGIQELSQIEVASSSPFLLLENYSSWVAQYRSLCLAHLYAAYWFLSKDAESMKSSLLFFAAFNKKQEFENFLSRYFDTSVEPNLLGIQITDLLYGQDKRDFHDLMKNLYRENFFEGLSIYYNVLIRFPSEEDLQKQEREKKERKKFWEQW
jgi:hypothetical protein